jgi:transposase
VPGCLVGMEACSAAHHWARELSRLGHSVRLIPPQYVKPYVKRNKTDAADAEAICEAVGRPNMRFDPIKTLDQKASCRCIGFARCSSGNALPRSTPCGDC